VVIVFWRRLLLSLHGPIISARNAYHTQSRRSSLVDRNRNQRQGTNGESYEGSRQQISRGDFVEGQPSSRRQRHDLLFHKNKLTEFSARFVRGVATHGTGCTYSAAIAAGLACGLVLEKAIGQAEEVRDQINCGAFAMDVALSKNLEALRHFL